LCNEDGENAFILGATVYTPLSNQTLEEQRVTPRIAFAPLRVLVDAE
jgi:hypothetical protein